MSRSKRPLLSVVVPVLDEEKRLVRGIEALMQYVSESGLDLEVIIVDDGSRDATPGLIGELTGRHPLVHSITLPRNRGTHTLILSQVAFAISTA